MLCFKGLELVGSDYQWQDGTKLQYNQWYNGEPNGGNTGERRVSINTNGFYDIPDNHLSTILCEKGISLVQILTNIIIILTIPR